MATFPLLGILIFLAIAMAEGASAPPPSARRQEIDTTNNLFRRAVEVYLRQNGENDFEHFQLHYHSTTQTIDISDWGYPSMTQPTRAQLIGLLAPAKRRLARLTEREKRREKNGKRVDLPPAVYVQRGTSNTGAGPWGAVAMREKGGSSSASIVVDTAGFYRISLSGKCIAGGGWLRVLDASKDLILHSEHMLVGALSTATATLSTSTCLRVNSWSYNSRGQQQ